jgi:hypothetical protein
MEKGRKGEAEVFEILEAEDFPENIRDSFLPGKTRRRRLCSKLSRTTKIPWMLINLIIWHVIVIIVVLRPLTIFLGKNFAFFSSTASHFFTFCLPLALAFLSPPSTSHFFPSYRFPPLALPSRLHLWPLTSPLPPPTTAHLLHSTPPSSLLPHNQTG